MQEAYDLVKVLEPTTPQEYIVKAVTCASLGQEMENSEMLKQAQHNFQLVGASASECDTIPGRQCMASCYFLLKQFDDALIYLKVSSPITSQRSRNLYIPSQISGGKLTMAEQSHIEITSYVVYYLFVNCIIIYSHTVNHVLLYTNI